MINKNVEKWLEERGIKLEESFFRCFEKFVKK